MNTPQQQAKAHADLLMSTGMAHEITPHTIAYRAFLDGHTAGKLEGFTNLFPLTRPYWKPPFHYDADSQAIYDSDTNIIVDIRGWGRLHGRGCGALKLSKGKAIAVQNEIGEHLCQLLNTAWTSQPQHKVEPVWEPIPKEENRYAGYRKGDLRIWHWVFPVGPDGFCVSRVDAASGRSSPLGVFETLDAAKRYASDWCESPKTNPQVNT